MTAASSLGSRERARPLAPDERREAILDAVLPLLRDKGRDVTSRELSDAAGVAEGTLFRAFGDKESLLAAALEKLFAPDDFLARLRAIPQEQPLDAKLTEIVEVLQRRFHDLFQIMSAFQARPPEFGDDCGEWIEIIGSLLHDDQTDLAVPVDEIVAFTRLVAFGASIEPLNASHQFSPTQLAALIARGVVIR